MKTRLLLALTLTALLAACGQKDATAPATDAAAPAAPVTEAAAPATAPADGADATPPAVDPAAAQAAEAAMAAAAQGPALVAGRDYTVIANGQPFEPLDGKVEVVEVFAYWCAHCAQFQPMVDAWKAKLPADVRFTYVPAVFQPADNFPRAFYAAQTIGQASDRLHHAFFKGIHIDRALKQNASAEEIATYAGTAGVDGKALSEAMKSFAIEAKIGRARQFAERSGVAQTPTLVVNGKYLVGGGSHEDQLRITNQLIAQERGASTP